jgi:hypothetical protein
MTSIIKVNTIQDAGGNTLLEANGSGTITTNNIGGDNTPAFSAYLGSNQTISGSTLTTIAFDTENFDSDSCYNTSTYRFTPTEAGKYLLFANTRLTTTANQTSTFEMEIRHSVQNSILRISGHTQEQTTWSGSVIATMNGTTDYVFVSFYHTEGSATLDAGNGDTLFGGFKLIGE